MSRFLSPHDIYRVGIVDLGLGSAAQVVQQPDWQKKPFQNQPGDTADRAVSYDRGNDTPGKMMQEHARPEHRARVENGKAVK
jgi:hypothetical protein